MRFSPRIAVLSILKASGVTLIQQWIAGRLVGTVGEAVGSHRDPPYVTGRTVCCDLEDMGGSWQIA